jgi:signal transduction histidine kinase
MTRSGRRKRCTETRRRSLASEAELLERATTLAERYGMALVAISRVLDESQSSDARKVWRVRLVLAGLDSETLPIAAERDYNR